MFPTKTFQSFFAMKLASNFFFSYLIGVPPVDRLRPEGRGPVQQRAVAVGHHSGPIRWKKETKVRKHSTEFVCDRRLLSLSWTRQVSFISSHSSDEMFACVWRSVDGGRDSSLFVGGGTSCCWQPCLNSPSLSSFASSSCCISARKGPSRKLHLFATFVENSFECLIFFRLGGRFFASLSFWWCFLLTSV